MKTIEIELANHPFLKGMDPAHLAILARHARVATFTTNEVVFRQGEYAHHFHLLLEGEVAVESYMARADDLPLQTVKAPGLLGWSWLFPPFVWHFQARALKPTMSIVVDGASLLVACEEVHGFGFQLMQRIAEVVVGRMEAAQGLLLEIEKSVPALPAVDEPRRFQATPHSVSSLKVMVAEHPFLKGMKAEHLEILADLAMKASFDPNQVIFHAGDPANRFYLIQHGRVALESQGKDADSEQFQILSDGDVVGWSWMFPPYYSHFQARSLEPTEGIFLYGTRLREECQKDPELGYQLMKRTVGVVIQRLQATRKRLVEIAALKSESETTGRQGTSDSPGNGRRVAVREELV